VRPSCSVPVENWNFLGFDIAPGNAERLYAQNAQVLLFCLRAQVSDSLNLPQISAQSVMDRDGEML
jgi:hypothetical protein